MFTATVIAGTEADAIERVARRLPEGFAVTGEAEVRSARHGLFSVLVENLGGNVEDAWIVLTSYGISPSVELGSKWEAVLGASA